MEQSSNFVPARSVPSASRQPQTPSQMLRTGTVYMQADPAKIPINYRKRTTAMQAEQIKELQVNIR